MAEQKIDLRKVRDFSQNINDTFVFIKQNLKPLLGSFLGIAGIFMLTCSIFNGLYQSQFGNIFKEIFTNPRSSRNPINTFNMFGMNYFLLIIFSLINIIAMQTAVIAYMKVYSNKDELPVFDEVWAEFKKYFLPILFYSIPLYLLIIVGMVFCLVPGIYFGVVLIPFPIVIMVEDASFGGAFNRCFKLIKQNFWPSFGIYIVTYIIYSFAAGIISFAVTIVSGLLAYFTTKDISTTIGIATSTLTIFSYIFYVVFYVAVVLHYFSLAEKQDGTGIMQRIDKLGNTDSDFTNIQEQY